ncbi:flagellar biosynthesis chaperone [Andreesenia angusta]|uniref:Flagellar FliJ protein n=1 Tax=Andreesenia angusta TaxID=39480 RepID=A0A1S1V815_9FIRM|nr:flagellar export protein FliJ [Andreesenia angusta]OHW62756.1 flagellar biosynthesis chaperone [Andreesenia angusta]
MAKFKFGLQRVLEIKEKFEDEKKNSYAEQKKKLEEENLKLEKLKVDMEQIRTERNSASGESMKIRELSYYGNYIRGLSSMIEVQNTRVEEKEQTVESAREELLEATKDRRILENLKLRSLEQYKYELKQEEDKLTDQFVSYSSSKKTRED